MLAFILFGFTELPTPMAVNTHKTRLWFHVGALAYFSFDNSRNFSFYAELSMNLKLFFILVAVSLPSRSSLLVFNRTRRRSSVALAHSPNPLFN